MKKHAFTLIELLVVIAIIAILAAILFPVFAQAKLAAKKTQDLSNIKNTTTANYIYSADYDDFYPRGNYFVAGRNLNGWNVPITWREQVMPYVKNGQSNYGTSSTGSQILLADGGIWDTPAFPNVRGAYTMNRNIAPAECYWDVPSGSWMCDVDTNGAPTGNPSMPSVSQTSLDNPAGTVAIFTVGINPDWGASGDYSEASWYWYGGAQWPPEFTGPNSHEKWDADTNASPSWSIARYRYNEGMNTGFGDGHAKYIKKGAFNWCRFMYVRGHEADRGESWAWLFDPGQPCAAFQ